MRRRSRKVRVPKKFTIKMQKKLLVIFGVVALLMVGLVVRLMYIEHTSGKKYEKQVLSQQEYDSITLPYQRGNITDSKGTVLATSVDVYNVILDCKVLTSNTDDIEPTIAALKQCFQGSVDEGKIRDLIKNKPKSQYNVLAKKLTYDQTKAFLDMQTAEKKDKKSKKTGKINGVWFEKEYLRQYPCNSLASAVIGFTTSGNVGMNGVENYYNSTLNGVNGREYGYLNSDNDFEKTVKEASNGDNVVLTIDANIQSVVEAKIDDFIKQNTNVAREGTGAKNVGAIVMNPNNGEILAMANYPNYNLSNPWDLSGYYTPDQIKAMDDKTKLDALNKLWTNFCVSNTYEPGSTVKPFTVASGLETGTLKGDETYFCDGSETIAGHVIHCSKTTGHGLETIQQAIMNSCNDALMQMSYAIGPANFAKYQKIFGFGYKTNIDLPGEARTDSLIYKEEQLSKINLATNAFGQNFNVNMIQVISAFSSIINGGSYYQPHVVKKITDDKNNTISDINGTLLKQTVSKKTSDMLKQYMYATVCEGGTGKDAKVDGYTMGGKTGTAQKLPRGQGNYLVSFIGYAPADKPQVAIYVVVDEPNAVDEAHSQFAQGIVKSILTEILPYMNIYPDENAPANAPANAAQDGPADAPADLPADTDATKAQNQKDNMINAPVTNPDAAQ